jgi:radical SAM superfamily enzyme YgiQ (UPF0313 family)
VKILLLSPNIKGVAGGINRIQPSLGLAYLASYLKNDHDVFIKDTAVDGWENVNTINPKIISIGESEEAISKYIQSINPDVVGISTTFTSLMDNTHIIANLCKQINPNIRVVVGGNHITNVINDYEMGIDFTKNIFNKNIDYYFIGESEINFVSFIKSIHNSTEHQVNGIAYFNKDNIVINKNTNKIDISCLLDPSWEYFNMEKYFSIGLFHSAQSYSNRVLPVMASRGCPEHCSFCTTPSTWGNRVRWKSPILIYKEIKKFVGLFNIGEIQFQDDTLTSNIKNLYDLCNYLEEFKLPWCTPNGIKVNYHEHFQEEMFLKMKKSGCYQITLGCESGSQRVLNDIINKNIKVSTFKETINKAKNCGLFVHTFWIVGFPGETMNEIKQTIDVAAKCGSDSFSLSIFNPFPGTKLYHEIVKQNLWWNINNTTFNTTRNSLIKVNGFSSPEEFEEFVETQNIYLNSILEIDNPIRYSKLIDSRGVHINKEMKKIKQT